MDTLELIVNIYENEGKIAEQVDRELVTKAIDLHDGNLKETAKWLGISQRHLYNKRIKYGLPINEPRGMHANNEKYLEMRRRYPSK